MRLILLGDSHNIAFASALSENPYQPVGDSPIRSIDAGHIVRFPLALRPFFQETGEKIEFFEEVATERLFNLTGSRSIDAGNDAVYGISFPFTTTALVRSPMWTEFAPWRTVYGHQAPLSDSVMDAIADNHFRHILQFLGALQRLRLPVFVTESPPLRRDEQAIGKTISPSTILELDFLVRCRVRRRIEAMGLDCIPLPAEAYEGEVGRSFLKADFAFIRKGDTHHANAAFGAAYLPSIIEHANLLARSGAKAQAGEVG